MSLGPTRDLVRLSSNIEADPLRRSEGQVPIETSYPRYDTCGRECCERHGTTLPPLLIRLSTKTMSRLPMRILGFWLASRFLPSRSVHDGALGDNRRLGRVTHDATDIDENAEPLIVRWFGTLLAEYWDRCILAPFMATPYRQQRKAFDTPAIRHGSSAAVHAFDPL
ncbi:unnamed protein product [Fusarium equiseti]|uniref:Uncharacterized protein n=1 Tax=Fusarium equiseti TaxID=61235 RepID=A0A8J2NC58_FUSEQ|nr:unnamed protein product [Fusarium equiseti]